MTPTRSPTAPAALWSNKAARRGFLSPPIMPSVMPWSATPGMPSRLQAAWCFVQCVLRFSTPRISLRSCSRPGLQGEGRRTRQCWRRHHQFHQASFQFGIVAGGQKLAGLLVFLTDIHSIGLKTAQGLTITSAWYWDKDDASRAFAKQFMARNHNGLPPTYIQAGIYSEVAHYLKAVKAAGTDDTDKVAAQMRKMKINDFMTKDGWIREDGRVMRDMYLEEVKSPAKSKYPFDYFKILATIPPNRPSGLQGWRICLGPRLSRLGLIEQRLSADQSMSIGTGAL